MNNDENDTSKESKISESSASKFIRSIADENYAPAGRDASEKPEDVFARNMRESTKLFLSESKGKRPKITRNQRIKDLENQYLLIKASLKMNETMFNCSREFYQRDFDEVAKLKRDGKYTKKLKREFNIEEQSKIIKKMEKMRDDRYEKLDYIQDTCLNLKDQRWNLWRSWTSVAISIVALIIASVPLILNGINHLEERDKNERAANF